MPGGDLVSSSGGTNESSAFVRGGASARALTEEEIFGIINDFGSATRRAIEAGFDGVELHGAHSFLLADFLSPRSKSARRRLGWIAQKSDAISTRRRRRGEACYRGLTGEFLIPMTQVIAPFLTAAVVAGVGRRNGRKLRLKVGDIEVEGNTEEDIKLLIAKAKELAPVVDPDRPRGDAGRNN